MNLESVKVSNELNNNSDNNSSDNESEKKKRNKPTKKQQFKNERDEFIKELNKIIGINDKNNTIFLYELENNLDVKSYLSNNNDTIRKYYKVGKWGFFSNDVSKGKDNYIGLLRSLYLDSDYEIISKLKINTFNNVKKQYTVWNFRKI